MVTKLPPNQEQITNMREYASQLEYAFRARPLPGTDGRASWEKRFMGTFGRFLKVLGSAHFTHLPPFAIACVWENNRRSYVDKNQPFNPELIGDAYDPAHPAYHAGNGHLIYKAAYDGPFAAIPENQLRSVWWTQKIDAAAAPQTLHHHGHGAEPAAASSSAAPAVPSGLGDAMDVDDEGLGDSRDAASVPSTRRGRSKARAVAATASSDADGSGQETRMTTRSSSRTRATSATPGTRGAPPAASSKKAPTKKAKGKAKEKDPRQLPSTDKTMAGVGDGSSEAAEAAGKGKGSRAGRRGAADRLESSGTLTLADITPETILPDDVPHPRPCTRCLARDEICMFNPLVRPGCINCDQGNAKCTLTFYNKRDHVMTAYLGYAWYRMLMSPAVFAPPDFSPAQYPSWVPAKKDIAWYEKQYREFRKSRTSSRGSSKKAPATSETSGAEQLAPEADDEADVLTDAASGAQSEDDDVEDDDVEDDDVEDVADIGSSKADSRRSGSTSSATLQTSNTLPGSSAASTSTLQASSTGNAQGVDGNTMREVESDGSTVSMPVDAEHMGPPHEPLDSSTAPVDRAGPANTLPSLQPVAGPSAKLPERPVTAVAPPSMVEVLNVSTLPDELSWETSSMWVPPPMPPAPPGSSKCRRHPFAINPIDESWEDLPRLAHSIGKGLYAIRAPPHPQVSARRISDLLRMACPEIDVVTRLGEAPAPSLSAYNVRPSTPEAETFGVTENIVALTRDAKVRYDEIASIQASMKNDAAALRRRAAALISPKDANTLARVDQTQLAREDVQPAFEYLAQVHEVLARFAAVFGSIPAVPWNWGALFELLTKMEEMKELYQITWERWDVLEEHLRPVRKELYQIRSNVAFVQGRVEEIVNEAILACEVLLNNMYRHLDNRLSTLEQRIRRLDGDPSSLPRPLEATIGDLLAMVTTLSARIDRLETAAGDGIASQIAAAVAKYLADRGLSEEVLDDLGERFGSVSMVVERGGSASDFFNVVRPIPSGGEYPAPPVVSAMSSTRTAAHVVSPAVAQGSALVAASALPSHVSVPPIAAASPPAHHTRARNPQGRGGRGCGN